MNWRFAEDLSGSDRGFEAEGADIRELLASAADATLAVMVGDPAGLLPLRTVTVRLEASNAADLVHALLQEIIYRKDAEGLFLRLADGAVRERGGMLVLDAVLAGEEFDPERHEPGTDVKAVTLHRFEVVEDAGRWKATVVLDV